MKGPLRATPTDYDSIIKLLDQCFTHDAKLGGMEAHWQHVYSRDPDQMRRAIIMKDGDKPVAHVRYVDQTALVNDSKLKIAGIHGVCTHPDYRGQGVMSQLLNQTLEYIEEEGYALSDLGGATPRYRRFGWEDGGREWHFSITDRSITQLTPPEGWKVKKHSGEKGDVEIIRQLHEEEAFRLARLGNIYSSFLKRRGKETYISRSRNGAAYFILGSGGENPSERSVYEFGGNPEGIHALISHLIEKENIKKIQIQSPWQHPVNALFRNLSRGCAIKPMRMIRIVNLLKTLKAFRNQIQNRYNALGTVKTINTRIVIEESGEAAIIRMSPQEMAITKTKSHDEANASEHEIRVSLIEATRLLFGPGTTNVTEGNPCLNAIFPLDFYIWGAERV